LATAQHVKMLVHPTVHPSLRPACLRLTLSLIQFYTARKVLPLESVVSVLAQNNMLDSSRKVDNCLSWPRLG
jgi:hypothetical protein